MNLKTTCIVLTMFTAAVPCSIAAGDPGLSALLTVSGGQAPPAPVGGSGFTVRVAKGLDEAAAKSLQQDLVNEGFTAAAARPAPDGTHEVVISGMSSRAQADSVVNDLKSSGYTTSVEVVGETQSAEAPIEANGQTVYRVKVAEFETEAQAIEASKILIDEGFVNVDVAEENGKHVLMLGTFNSETDAQALLGDVNRAGFALASVVSKDRLRPDTVRTADVSTLPASEQALAKEALQMAQKVESGEASADEMKRLREMIQQMSTNQRQVLNQQESTRAASQDKNLKIYELYRQFDKAIGAEDYVRAEQILNEVRQIDPDDIFLSRRVGTLESRRSGSAGVASGAPSGRPDPVQIQNLINEARAAETAGNTSLAADKYSQILALDPSNTEARSKSAQLGSATTADETADAMGGILENKTLLYAIGGVVLAIVALLFWMKSRSGKAAAKEPTPAGGTNLGAADYSSTLGGAMGMSGSSSASPAGGLSTGMPGGLAGTGIAGGVPDYSLEETSEEEQESTPVPSPAPPAPAAPKSDMVSLDEFEQGPQPPAPSTGPAPVEDEVVSLNFEDEVQAPTATESPATPAPSGKAMDADLEALLKGSFGGVEGAAEGTTAGSLESQDPRIVYAQDFDNLVPGSAVEGWRGEYDYASLTIDDLGDGHNRCLKYEKPEGAGSATYHLTFPKTAGKIIAEFDLRCDEKNKFLLGIYLEHEEDFKQSVHTIIHQLDPSAPASLRIQGEAAPYAMGEWRHVRYEIDLPNAKLDAYMDGEHIVNSAELAAVPEYINTLSIRDNLATTGTLYLDNLTITEL